MEKDTIQSEDNSLDIAVIGMAGRFPGAKNIDELWQGLYEGRESISFFSDEELMESGIDINTIKDPRYVKAAGILDSPDSFDAPLFKYSPREVEIMDPQQRLFLECSREALEHAGYDTERYEGSVGVYAGTSRNTYMMMSDLVDTFASRDLATVIGNDNNFLTTRVSYKLNLKGPSVSVQTACSTSLVAIHMACQSLLNEECDMALAGGASVRFPHKAGYLYQPQNIASPDGHCRAFDEKAQGTVFGSGVGVVLLKRLADAIRDGDYIHAVVKGSAINNDGHLKMDYTAPSIEGQSQVIVEAIANAGIEADSISYVEAHGTGTSLGDPVEVAALTKAFRNYTHKNGYCAIGSIKTNIGHLDAAAGVTSFIKTVMALKHKVIPPTLHFNKPNPEIDFKNSPFYVNNKLMDWEAPYPRRSGVSSFGIGGTNAHVILEEAPEIDVSREESKPWQLLLLSAKTDTALEAVTANLTEHLKNNRDINLADAAFTLQTGRNALNHRRMLACRDTEDAIKALEESDKKRILTSVCDAAQRDVVFVFSGQGSQYVNMGLDLYQTEPVFKKEMDRCFEILQPHLNIDLHDIIYPDGPVSKEASERLTQTTFTQPALFAIEYALAKVWMSWGVQPAAMVGHSIGEYVAACLAGVFSVEDALKVVAARGRLMQEMPGGSMLAVFLSENEIRSLIDGKLSVATINLPSLCVISGEKEVISDLEKQLSDKKVLCRHVRTSHAFHSEMMEPIMDKFAEQVKQVELNTPQIPFVSNVSGTWIKPDEATNPEYWSRHLRSTVRFSDCVTELSKETNRVFLEVGPGSTFSSLIKQHPAISKEYTVLASTRHPKEETPDTAYILDTLGQLWMAGVQIDWNAFNSDSEHHRLPLPTYPFERQRYWISHTRKPKETGTTDTIPSGNLGETDLSAERDTGIHEVIDRVCDEKDIEQILATMWQDILGVKRVKSTDNFFDLGGSSLLAVSLFSKIEYEFQKRLPLAVLMKAPTIKQLAQLIHDEKPVVDWSSLIEIQQGNGTPPLFFIHAAGGNLLIYRELIRLLGPEQTIYGLQAQGLDGKQAILTNIEDMATQYVKEILAVFPEGPYMLAGYCMGGTLAFEMAQQLRAQGKEVALLALMETYDFSKCDSSTLSKMHYRIQQIEFHLRNLLLTDKKMTFFKEKAKVAWQRKDLILASLLSKLDIHYNAGNGNNESISKIWQACDRAAINYVPKVYPGKITEFRPMREYACFSNPEQGWDKLTTGGLETYELPVYPRGMLVKPFVEILAKQFSACIQNAIESTVRKRKTTDDLQEVS